MCLQRRMIKDIVRLKRRFIKGRLRVNPSEDMPNFTIRMHK